jgi:hypothetical protein
MYINKTSNGFIFSNKKCDLNGKNFTGSITFFKWQKHHVIKDGFQFCNHNKTITKGLLLPFFCFQISLW